MVIDEAIDEFLGAQKSLLVIDDWKCIDDSEQGRDEKQDSLCNI